MATRNASGAGGTVVAAGEGTGRVVIKRPAADGRWYFRLTTPAGRSIVVAERSLRLAGAPNARDAGASSTTLTCGPRRRPSTSRTLNCSASSTGASRSTPTPIRSSRGPLGLYKSAQVEFAQPLAVNEYRKLFRAILVARGRPIIIHCPAGQDRTGFAVYLLQRIVGVSAADAMRGYLLSRRTTWR